MSKDVSFWQYVFESIELKIAALFAWSEYIDVKTFSFDSNSYLLQVRVNRLTNAKKFNIVKTRKFITCPYLTDLSFDELKKCGVLKTKLPQDDNIISDDMSFDKYG